MKSEGEDVLGGVHVVRSQCVLKGRTACGVIVGGVCTVKCVL